MIERFPPVGIRSSVGRRRFLSGDGGARLRVAVCTVRPAGSRRSASVRGSLAGYTFRTIDRWPSPSRTSSPSPGMPLKLLAGKEHADRPIRWVHVSELEDPTPWLKGGELILTTGMGIGTTPAKQRAYVKRLAKAGLAGLGFGLGFSHDKTPRSLVTAAAVGRTSRCSRCPIRCRSSRSPRPCSRASCAEQYDTLQRAVDAEHVLTRAVMEGQGIRGHRAVARRRHEGVGVAARPARLADRQHEPRGRDARRSRVGGAA